MPRSCSRSSASVTPSAEADPSAVVADIESRSTRLLTPCGDGQLVWHRWGRGPTVVLLHGGFGSWTHWIRTIPPLAERWTVLAPDLPGLGESALPHRPGDPDELVRILADGLAAIAPAPTSYHLAGFSFGGVLCGPLAALEGDRVRSVTLIGAGGVGPPWSPVELDSWREVADPVSPGGDPPLEPGPTHVRRPCRNRTTLPFTSRAGTRRGLA